MIWNLSRPKPALPSSYFWTWDHSTNWVLDDPGLINHGCDNRYTKRPETFIEDYRRLTDLAADLGVKGILIWGFIRDSHGGIDSSKRVAEYAASKAVAIMPGFGTTYYGGAYYEGDHPYNLETFIENYPDARMIDENGNRVARGACASSLRYQEWLHEAVNWLFDEFEIGGLNLENGDFMVCHDPGCKAHKERWPKDDPEFFRFQAMSYEPALRAIQDRLSDKMVTWATYTGFLPGQGEHRDAMPYMQCERPALIDRLPEEAICQWTLTGMVRRESLPLTAYLDNGAPDAALDNPNWSEDLRPPGRRSCGYLHQPSQWSYPGRYDLGISVIKEGCLKAYRSGLEGVVIQGEVTSRHIPAALNYLAFSHFIHWPEDTVRDFGIKTLGQVFGSAEEGEAFVELLAHQDAGTLNPAQKKEINDRELALWKQVSRGFELDRWRFWHWLNTIASGKTEPHTVSFF